MQVLENIWLDDDTFIVDGKKMTWKELWELPKQPKTISMSSNNKELLLEESFSTGLKASLKMIKDIKHD